MAGKPIPGERSCSQTGIAALLQVHLEDATRFSGSKYHIERKLEKQEFNKEMFGPLPVDILEQLSVLKAICCAAQD